MNLAECLIWFLAAATDTIEEDDPNFSFHDWCRFHDWVDANLEKRRWLSRDIGGDSL